MFISFTKIILSPFGLEQALSYDSLNCIEQKVINQIKFKPKITKHPLPNILVEGIMYILHYL